jgi:hypothetical protein
MWFYLDPRVEDWSQPQKHVNGRKLLLLDELISLLSFCDLDVIHNVRVRGEIVFDGSCIISGENETTMWELEHFRLAVIALFDYKIACV